MANGDGLNVLIKREAGGFSRRNTVEKTGHNRYRVWPNVICLPTRHKVRPHHPLNRNLIITGSKR
ncbi:hypothetical protein KCP77_14370 [Salmonella enterica subsp. enterica]|nr:hypothetical protein KCP77_14370 [Salmonella enterica subsp. enterica]